MSVVIEALYIFEELKCILEHTYATRPPPPQDLITRFRNHPPPRPSVLYLPDLVPATTVYSITHGNLLLLCTSSKEAPALAILEFLNRVVDVFEDFLGSPLISTRIEENFEVIAQLLNEMCDGGVVCNTEGNALREQVEISTGLGKLFNQVGIPTSAPTLGPSSNLAATLKAASSSANGPAIPWRKQNVKHTSNEIYVDMVESLAVVFAPSGRPISARADGSILFTSKISGVPELLLNLTAPGGTSTSKAAGISRTMQLPTFHPCVRLARWKDHPGELSFVPPDGRFMLAGYETDLLPSPLDRDDPPSRSSEKIFLPATVDLRTNLGPKNTDFEARLTLNPNFPGLAPPPASGPAAGRSTSGLPPFSSFTSTITSASTTSTSTATPTLDLLSLIIHFPPHVRNVTDLKPSRGEATFHASTKTVEWKVPTKDSASSLSGTATLTGTVTGPLTPHHADESYSSPHPRAQLSEYYDDEALAAADADADADANTDGRHHHHHEPTSARAAANGASPQPIPHPPSNQATSATRALMPRSVSVSFAIKGWLASGIKVESLTVDAKRSKGLGDGVKPYKGVKYLTVSKQGVERRIE